MGKPINKPIKLTAILVDRETKEIAQKISFKNRLPRLLILKLGAWLAVVASDYPPDKYKLLLYVEGDDHDKRVAELKNWAKTKGITLLEDVIPYTPPAR